MKFVLAGATGLVGGEFLHAAERAGDTVITVGRRTLDRGAEEILTDFTTPVELPDADVAICTLGTTIARAGSRQAFYAVDHDAVLQFAQDARAATIKHFMVVTAVGANPRSRIFYSRVKGEVERDLRKVNFDRLDVAHPGLLIGPRKERRPAEALFQALDPVIRPLFCGRLDRYGSIPAHTVAGALRNLARDHAPGFYVHENRDLRTAAQRCRQ